MVKIYLNILVVILILLAQSELKAEGNMRFIENKGQWNSDIAFQTRLNFGEIYFEKDNFTFVLYDLSELSHKHDHNESCNHHHDADNFDYDGHHLKLEFLNTNTNISFTKENKSNFYYNYFLGNNPSHWASKAYLYESITYQNLYDGIDMKLFGSGDNMKYEYYVKPGANIENIKVQYKGVKPSLNSAGNLVYETKIAHITETKPFCYQIIDGHEVEVACNFTLDKKNNIVSYNFPNGYNTNHELVIDPELIFSSYTGSTLDNFGYTATYDNDGNLYGGGIIFHNNVGLTGYPVVGAFQSATAGGSNFNNGFPADISISKFNQNGSGLIYSTLIGGSDNEQPHSLVVNNNNELIIYGRTYSPDFPMPNPNGYDISHNGLSDIIVLKLSADGSAIIGNTFIGGSGLDGVNIDAFPGSSGSLKYNYADDGRGEVIVDELGNIYLASFTRSSDIFPLGGSFQTNLNGEQDAIVVKLNTDLSSMLWGSYLGGSTDDAAYGIKFDSGGNVFVSGGTNSNDFPETALGLITNFQGGRSDGFVSKISSDGQTLITSTYLGTSNYDQCYFIEIDLSNNVYVYGQSANGQYPVNGIVYSNPNSSQFIHKLNNDLNTTIFSTVFGSGSADINISPTAFLVDQCERIYVAGWGGDTNLGFANGNTFGMPTVDNSVPASNYFQSTTNGNDLYFAVFEKNASDLLYGTYFGGAAAEHVDGGTSRFDSRGTIYHAVCAGCGGNSAFPAIGGQGQQVVSTTNNSNNCNLGVIKMDIGLPITTVTVDAFPRATGCVPLTVNFESELINVTSFEWNFGNGFTSTDQFPTYTYTDTGLYVVQLIGIDSNSCNVADTAYLTVEVRDNVLFPSFADSIVVDCFSSSVSINGPINYPATQYSWNMGDGTTYNTQNITHTYNSPGSYIISLFLEDSTSCNLFDSITYQVFIPPLFDIEVLTNDTLGCVPLSVNFEGQSNSTNASYCWDFGDGNTSNLQNVSHTFGNVGDYIVQFVGVDSSSCNIVDTFLVNITVIDNQAIANFGTSENWIECDSLHLTVFSTVSNATAHFWDFGNGITSTDSVTTVFLGAGNYNITYIVHDAAQFCSPYDTATFSITILERLQINLAASDTFGCIPLGVIFEGISYTSNTNFNWNFGDGNTSTNQIQTHTYPNIGTFNVVLVGIDSATCNIIDSVGIQIETTDNESQATFGTSENWIECDSLHLTIFSTVANAASHFWSVNNGFITSSDSAATFFLGAGSYSIQYIIEDTSQFCSPFDTNYFNIQILERLEIGLTSTDTFGCVPLTVDFNAISNTLNASFSWNFGDGNSSTLQNPTNIYITVDTFSVILVAIDSNTCNIIDSVETTIITDNESITASYSSVETNFGCDSLVVNFTSTSTTATNHFWDFGNGSTSTLPQIETYFGPGNFNGYYVATDTNIVCNPVDTVYFNIELLPFLTTTLQSTETEGCTPHSVSFSSFNSTNSSNIFWDFGNGNTSTDANPTIVYTIEGTYNVQLIVTDTNSCNIADTNFITIRAFNDSAIANINVVETHFGCDSIQLSLSAAHNGGTHTWAINNNQVLVGQNVNYTISSYGNYNINYVLVDTNANCQTTDTASYSLNFYPVNAALQASATSGCTPLEVDFINLSTNAVSYFWTNGIGSSGTNENLPTIVYTEVGNYTFTLVAIDSNSCNIADTVFANISTNNDSITANFDAQVLNACDSLLSIDLTNTSINGVNYFWDFEISQSQLQQPGTFNYTTPGQYTITLVAINENLCNPYDTIRQDFILLPNLEAVFNVAPNCVGLPIVLNNNSPIETANVNWNFGDGSTSTSWQPDFAYNSEGNYTISIALIDSNTCNIAATDTQFVEIISNPVASFYTDTNYYYYPDGIIFNNTSNNYTNYEWFLGDGTYNNEDETFEHFFESLYGFTNCIVAYNEFCVDTFCRDLYIDFIRLIGVPNAFSPNGDGFNDIIFVEGEGIVLLNFKIYNRWGEIVFETNDQSVGWNGVYKGVLQEMEVYTYFVDATFVDGENVKLKGNITLLR